MGVDPLGRRRVEAGAAGEDEVAAVGEPEVDPARLEVVGEAEQVLGRVDDVVGDPERAGRRRWSSRRAGPRRGRRCRRARSRPRSGCRRRRRRRRGRSRRRAPRGRSRSRGSAASVVDGLDVVAALERVDDEVLEPVGDRRRVRVDDDQHPLLRRGSRARSRARAGARSRRWTPSLAGGGGSPAILPRRRVRTLPRLGGLEAHDLAVLVDLAHAAVVHQQVDVADHLGERQERLGDRDVPPQRLGELVGRSAARSAISP